MKTVYIELFFIDNLLVNYYLLFLCGQIQKKQMSKGRGLFCSALGGVYGFLQLWRWEFLNNIFLKGMLSIAMVYWCYKPEKKDFFNLLLWFYLFSFAFAGGIFTLYYLSYGDVLIKTLFFLPVPLRIAGIIVLAGQPLKKRLLCLLEAVKYRGRGIMLRLELLRVEQRLGCYADTGNLCTYRGLPVAFVNENRLKGDIRNYINNFKNGNICNIDEHSDNSTYLDFSYIPFKTAGGDIRTTLGIKCKDAVLTDAQGKKVLCLYVALTDHDFGGEPCLINPILLD